MNTQNFTSKDVQGRLPPALLKALRDERTAANFKLLMVQAVEECPDDITRAAVRFIQLCGRVPTAEQIERIQGAATGAAAPEPSPSAETAEGRLPSELPAT